MRKYDAPRAFDDEEEALGPSRTQAHREAKRIEGVGKRLIEMPAPDFEAAPLPERVRDAVEHARGLKKGALKRQALYVGKLLRELDDEDFVEIDAFVQGEGERKREEAFAHKQVERWRERMIAGGDDVIGEFLAAFPSAERPRLRQLARAAKKEAAQDKPPAAARKLFRYVREVLESSID